MNEDQAPEREVASAPTAADKLDPEPEPAPTDQADPPVSLQAFADARALPHWQRAALRTKCPIEQHMRHGRGASKDGSAQNAYLAHTDRHELPAGEWEALLREIIHAPIGRIL